MFTNSQSRIICGVLAIAFFISGLLGILDHLITKIILGSLLILIILNLFLVKRENTEHELDDSNKEY